MRRKGVIYFTILLTIGFISNSLAQNTLITDDDSYPAESSAILDVKSLTKGLLVPRMSETQRIAIVSPADGLLVFDTTNEGFYFYKSGIWTQLSSGQIWETNGSQVFLSDPNDNVGVGISNPGNKMLVKADASTSVNEAIFAVQNQNGDTVFAVYPEGVRIWVNDNGGSKAVGSRGGFAVGGFSPAKAGFTNEYLRVTPDSVRIYINDDFTGSKAVGNRGGFAVGGFSPAKGSPTDDYLFVQDDSTRIYVSDSMAGFSVSSIEGLSESQFMDLTTQNYFIGHLSGANNTTGTYNSFLGYKAGLSNTSGYNNLFLGFKNGIGNTTGFNNIFIGNNCGVENEGGRWNIFIGNQAGPKHYTGWSNIFIGDESGFSDSTGIKNTYIGDQSGYSNVSGQANVFLGAESGFNTLTGGNTFIGWAAGKSNKNGMNNTCLGFGSGSAQTDMGSGNVFLGYNSGYNETGSNKLYIENSSADQNTALIYGEFDNDWLRVNGMLGVNVNPVYNIHAVNSVALNDDPAIYGEHSVTDNYGVGVKGVARWRGVIGDASSSNGNISGLYGVASGTGTGDRYGIYATASGGATAYAGYFQGNVHVNGTLSKSAGTFKIDHPLDPENKYLVHSFVESPDMKNIYDGVIVLDNNGKASVKLPKYFEVLNKDFRYQLTTIGGYAPVYVEQEVKDGQFVIAGGSSGMKVSWQVTGIRKDPYAVANPIEVEPYKNKEDKGSYLNPELYNQPKTKTISKSNK